MKTDSHQKLLLLGSIGLLAVNQFNATVYGQPVKEKKRINILFLMSDQHRGDCMGVAGANYVITPNLDRLAGEGIMFRKAYASVPSCLPARTSLLTGMSPWASGQLGYNRIADYKYEKPAMFTAAGYRTHVVGKNHFSPKRHLHGYQSADLDEDCLNSVDKEGFEKSDYPLWFAENFPDRKLSEIGLGCCDHRGAKFFPFEEFMHPTFWTADRAVDFLTTYNGDEPWLLKVSFHRPHPPFDIPKRWYDAYEGITIPLPSVSEWAEEKYDQKISSFEIRADPSIAVIPEEEIILSRRSYYAGISFMDEQLGRVLEALKERGELENTLILYTSDHGDMMGDQHMWRKCRPYDGAALVPMIIRVPESLGIKVTRGQKRNELVELRDVLPTFLDAAGIPKPDVMDGLSMLNILRNKKWRKTLDLEHSQIYEKENGWLALTDGKYKYIYFNLTGEEQLFDLESDPKEMNNLAVSAKNEKLTKTWRDRMISHLKIRGEEWVKEGKLVVQKEAIPFGINHPKFQNTIKP